MYMSELSRILLLNLTDWVPSHSTVDRDTQEGRNYFLEKGRKRRLGKTA
ncbi:hypothetical protein Nmel_013632 [Mimus melanotis]